MDGDEPRQECEVCGGTSFYVEAGHFYCNECQTQSQQIREQVFERESATINRKDTRKIQKDKTDKVEDKLTSWECYNVILKGLTEELIGLGAKQEVKLVVKCLWMEYLQRCEVFAINSDRPPKVSVIGSRKDIGILYNVKRKRRRSRTSSTSTTLSIKRQRSSKKRALIKSQYDALSQSQTLTQNSSTAGETLSSLKSGSEKSSDSSRQIEYNRYSDAQLKKMMSKEHRQEHKLDVEHVMSCHKFRTKDFSESFSRGPTILTYFTLYSILYIALLIVGDPIQLGDMLRFIKEGHLSSTSYIHFFGEDRSDKSLNMSKRTEKKLFNHEIFRKRTAKLAQFLRVEKCIKTPNLRDLCARYCSELNLPNDVLKCANKLIFKTSPKMTFTKESTEIPNYEARAMSFIVFILKLLFGLDGITENELSLYAEKLNNSLERPKMFNFKEWLRYLGYRDRIITTYHMIYSLDDHDSVDSDMYLDYFKNQEVKFSNTGHHIHSEVKDYLQVLEKLGEEDYETSDVEMKFEASLTPFLSYTDVILDNKEVECKNVLVRTFRNDSLEFLLKPNKYLDLLGTEVVRNRGANDNIVIEDILHVYKDLYAKRKGKNSMVTVQLTDEDRNIKECLDFEPKPSLVTTDVAVFLSNWREGNKDKFLKNRTLLEIASENVEVELKADLVTETYPEHFNPFERYWLNIPANPTIIRNFSMSRMEEIRSKLSHAFRIVLRDVTRTLEQETYQFYSEFLVTEMNLVYFGGYCLKKKKVKKVLGLQRIIRDCAKCW